MNILQPTYRLLIFPLLVLLFIGSSFLQPKNVFASEKLEPPVTIKLFWGSGCPHCKAAESFLDSLQQKYSNLQIEKYEIYYNKENQILIKNEAEKLGIEVKGVPFIVVGNEYSIGYQSDDTTGKQLVTLIENAKKKEQLPPQQDSALTRVDQNSSIPDSIALPFIGEVKTSSLSLPVFTVVVAAVDGFNPCAMWTLLFLISLLLGVKDRARMWLLGSVFIITSAVIYLLFLSAWLQLFSFFGYIKWLQVGIGLLAFGAGSYYLWDFWNNKNGSCRITDNENRKKVFLRLKALTGKKQLALAVIGIIGLAIAVNFVELICSAGLPAIYTQVLSLSDVLPWQYYAYLLLYTFVFMLDDLFVFFTAMITLKAIGIDSKYAKISHCVGGFLLLIIGVLLIFKPELLLFG